VCRSWAVVPGWENWWCGTCGSTARDLDVESVGWICCQPVGVCLFVRVLQPAHRHELFPEEMFADLSRGERRPSRSRRRVIASVIVLLQDMNNLYDARAGRRGGDVRPGWKAACGLRSPRGGHRTTLTCGGGPVAAPSAPEPDLRCGREVVYRPGCWRETGRALGLNTILDGRGAHAGHGDSVDRRDPPGSPRGARRREGSSSTATARDYAPPK